MNKEMLELAKLSIKTAKSAGADNCRAGIRSERFVEISYRERKPENIKEASTKGLNIEIFVNGRFSNQSTSDLRAESLKDFISNAVKMTKLLAEDKFRTLPDPKYYEGRQNLDLGIFDPEYENYSAEKRHEIVKSMENACLKVGGEKVISVTSFSRDSLVEVVRLSSNGFEGYRKSSSYTFGASLTAKDEGDRRPSGYNYLSAVSRKGLSTPEEIGETAAKRTLMMLGAKKVKTAILPVIIENRNVPNLLGGLLGAMNGQSLHQKQSFLANKKGDRIASEKLTLIDDPFVMSGLGSRLFDGDGFATKKRIMIDKGILKEYYIDWYYSRKLGWEPSTGGSSNLIIPPGNRSIQEIMKDLGKGILITGFIGGNSNSTTGDSSIGIFGRLFENGIPVQAVAEMNIADNHLKFWPRLIEVANDPWVYSAYRTPSLVFADVVVSGA
jgi:PmbA protein